MREELDKQLCEKYPKLFQNRHASMSTTCMCWGFACGEGWYPIINALCQQIDGHVSWARKQRARALVFNRKLKRAIAAQNISYLLKPNASTWEIRDAEEDLALERFKDVPERVEYVVVDQVKEKFGTLRFYYHGGDSTVYGMVRMAEAMSAVICEKCSAPATTAQTGYWVNTLCDCCRKELDRG